MLADHVAATGLAGLHLAAMVLFLVVFVAVVAHTFLGREARRRMARAATLPFEDGEPLRGGDREGRVRP